MKKLRPSVGQWVRTLWDDVGARDGIVVDHNGESGYRLFFPFDNGTCWVETSQIIALGKRLEGKDSGL
jgi:hypothetical protein